MTSFDRYRLPIAVLCCLWLISWGVNGGVARAQETGEQNTIASAPDCIKEIDRSDIEAVLNQSGEPVLGIYPVRCNGGLYLLDLKNHYQMWRINRGWWFERFGAAYWTEDDSDDSITVEASFITGIGPTGVEPFWVQITMQREGEQWVPTEPVHLESANREPIYDGDIWIAESALAFDGLSLRPDQRKLKSEIDFDKSRFVQAIVWLTSGALSITDVLLEKDDKGYVLTYLTKSNNELNIGTTNMRHVSIHAIVPKDGLPIRLDKKGRYVDTKTKALDKRNKPGPD